MWYLALFFVGAFVMRGAGCTYNDIVDRDYDASVARTAARPIPSGQVSVAAAQVFLAVLCLVGLVVLLQFNLFTIVLGAASLLLVAIYPFMKRFTYWPQLVLGLTFKWGALVGWAAVTGSLALAPLVLYAGSRAVDHRLRHHLRPPGQGGRPAARPEVDRAAASATRRRAGSSASMPAPSCCGGWPGCWPGARSCFSWRWRSRRVQFAWQVATLDIADAGNCLARFKSNRWSAGCCSSGSRPTWRWPRCSMPIDARLTAA